MSDREHLTTAGDLVASAADRAGGDAGERLDGLADQLHRLAERSTAPDHGRLARLLNAIEEIEGEVDDGTAGTLAEAREHITEFRKTIEGV